MEGCITCHITCTRDKCVCMCRALWQTDLQAALQVPELPIVCEHQLERLVHRHLGESLDARKAVPPLLQLVGRSEYVLGVCFALHKLLHGTAEVCAPERDLERDLAHAEAIERARRHFAPRRLAPSTGGCN